MRQLFVFGLAAFATGCLAVQRLPDGQANYGGLTTPRGVTQLQSSATVATAVREASRSGQPVTAMFDGNGGGSIQVGYQYGYGFYPGAYGYDPQFGASAMRTSQVWGAQVAAEQPVPIGHAAQSGPLEPRVRSLEGTVGQIVSGLRRKAAAPVETK